MKTKLLLLVAVICIALTQSCKDDDPTFTIAGSSISSDDYTAGGTLKVLYSVDGGKTFTETLPSGLGSGTKVQVKVNNGTTDLSSDDFEFDWTGSSPAPASLNGPIAEFTVSGGNVTIQVKVTDKMVLITNHRSNGKFYQVNTTTGDLTVAFAPKLGADTLKNIRGFVFHKKKGMFYATLNTDAGSGLQGDLFTINTATKAATKINDNNGSNTNVVWDAVVDWVVAPDDSLIGVGDFNNDGNGIVKFGTDGGRSKKTVQADICCGLGLLYDGNTTLTVGNGWNGTSNLIVLQSLALSGTAGTATNISTFEGFSESFTNHWVTMKAMAKAKDGTIYGILFDSSSSISYLVTINLSTPKITQLKKIGLNSKNQYQALDFVPAHTL